MAADDLWAQMQAEESRYAASNRHRVAKTSLASLATQVKPKAAEAKRNNPDGEVKTGRKKAKKAKR